MANDINKVFLIGRLTQDPQLKYTNAGAPVMNFSIAINRRKKVADAWQEEASFFEVQLWGKIAESLEPYLSKGKQVAVTGELRQSRWESDGQKRSKVFIAAETLQMLGDSNGGQQRQSSNGYAPRSNRPKTHSEFTNFQGNSQPPQKRQEPRGPELFEDDIPF